jgi:hypothetical protein
MIALKNAHLSGGFIKRQKNPDFARSSLDGSDQLANKSMPFLHRRIG